MASFANEYTAGGRFRYLGAGVKLGSADRIVLFYRLKRTGTYRAVYGDLTVKDVKPEDPVRTNASPQAATAWSISISALFELPARSIRKNLFS